MSPISKADGDKARDGKLNWAGCKMKNYRIMGEGRVWRRPVKIKELKTKNRVVGTLQEIDFAVNR